MSCFLLTWKCHHPGGLWVTALWRWAMRPQPRGVFGKSMGSHYQAPVRYVCANSHSGSGCQKRLRLVVTLYSLRGSSWTGQPLGNRTLGESRRVEERRCLRRLVSVTDPLFALISLCFSQMYSLFVGDLTPEVDDGMLYEFFYNRYPSCRGGKVVLDSMGNSKWVLLVTWKW